MQQTQQSVRLLHLGNVFLDCPFSDMDAKTSAEHRMRTRSTFREAVEWAEREGIHLVLISGDLFDNSYATLDTLRFLRSVFASAPSVRFVITPGAHDFIWDGSLYRLGSLPENVYVFDRETPEHILFPEINTMVTGWAFRDASDPGAPLHARRICPHEGASVVMGYGSFGETAAPANIREEDIAVFGGDYLALSGANLHSGFHTVSGTVWAYSGSPENAGYDEMGVGGANLITLTPGGEKRVSAKRINFGHRRFETEEIEVTGITSAAQIRERVRTVMKERGYGSDTALRVIFTGGLPIEIALPDASLSAELGLYCFTPVDATVPACDESGLARDMTARGELARTLIPKMRGDDPDAAARAAEALRAGLTALGGK